MIAKWISRPLAFLFFIAALARTGLAADAATAPTHTYPSGWGTVSKMAFDIQGALKPQYKELIHEQPVSLDTDVKPFIKLEEYADEKKPMPMIFISVGFLDLINNLAHAKAIGLKDKKYYQKYIDSLSTETGVKELAALPDIDNEAYWSDDVMNEQLSNFNSVAGIFVSVNFAHHYLGQFKKHEKEIMDDKGNSTPINKVLTAEEYEAAFAAGVHGALDAGILVEGLNAFFEAFEKMKTRPEWAIYFMPETVKVAKLKKIMAKIQYDFLHGKG